MIEPEINSNYIPDQPAQADQSMSAHAQTIAVNDLGLIDYEKALEIQLSTLTQFKSNTLIFCSHPRVVTTGRATQKQDIINWSGKIVEVSRGGRATYHGPNQLVIYPIVDLKKYFNSDLHKYLRFLESVIIATLKNYNLDCSNKSQSVANDENQTGVWINDKKIASIGIAVKSWISYHGIAINVHSDPEAFVGINPCGYSPNIMTSMQDQLQRPVDLSELKNIFYKTWVEFFDRLLADAKKNC